VEKTDRLYRNFRDYIALEDLELEIHLIKEGEILSKNSRSHVKFIHGIKVLMAKNYIDNLSEEVKKGMLEKAEQGGFPGKVPVGYINNEQTHTVDVDEARAGFIRKLFELYASGEYSLTVLRAKCVDVGFKTRRSEKRISRSNLAKVLKNIFYTGHFY
jgi:DNA invertase Pin-like site-specific DNA recombinase